MNLASLFKKQIAVESEKNPLFDAVAEAIRDAQIYSRSHGGDIKLVDVSPECDVTIQLKGACAMCPLSTVTIRLGVENRLREQVPEVRKIIVK